MVKKGQFRMVISVVKKTQFLEVIRVSSYRVRGSGAVLFKLRQNRTNSITTPI